MIGSFRVVAALSGPCHARSKRLPIGIARARSGDFAPLRFLPKGKTVVLGLITTKLGELESRENVLLRIEEAAKFVDIDQLALSPQCGFASTVFGDGLSAEQQAAKIRLVTEVAAEVWGGRQGKRDGAGEGPPRASVHTAIWVGVRPGERFILVKSPGQPLFRYVCWQTIQLHSPSTVGADCRPAACAAMNVGLSSSARNAFMSAPSRSCVTSGRPMWSITIGAGIASMKGRSSSRISASK